MIEKVRSRLRESVDEKYCEFNKSLVPGDVSPMLGVRMPVIRKLAKELAKENAGEYINAVIEQERAGSVYHEELLLHGMIIGYMKCSVEERAEFLDRFVPLINNWAVCDSCCNTYKFIEKDKDYWFRYLEKYINSGREYEIRFAVVTLLDFFVTEEYIERVLEILGHIDHEGYYVKMAVAWTVSVCYIKFPSLTWGLLESSMLDDFTQNKSIQKIRESYRVEKKEKERVTLLRRKVK